ncbi:MAG: hypothetical protein RL514_4463 [Verrucomicrobiota bacterium]|jgi:hypothetical protein
MHYRAYNLVIESPLPLAPLSADETGGTPDIVIRQASVATDGLPVARNRRAFAHVGENAVWLDVKGVARFLIERGETITFEPYAGADDDSLRLYLLGSGLGALLHQRGHLVLHANAVQVGDGAVLFAGVSGAGKSTTAAVFHQQGYRVIADDVTAVDGEGRALGGSPHLKLWEDALDQLKIGKDGLAPIRCQVRKFSFPLVPVISAPLPIRAVYFLAARNEHEEHQFEFHPLEGIAKFNQLKANTYRRNFLEGLGLKPRHLQLCSRMAQNIVAARIVRPSREFNAVQLVERVLEHLRQKGLDTSPGHE